MGANIKISSDSKQFINEMKQVTNNLKLVDSTLSVATEKAKLFGNSTDKLKAQHAQLSNTLKSNNKILDLQNKTVNSLTSDIQKYTSRNTELSKSIASVGDKLKAQIKATGEDSKETKVLQQELNKLHNEYNSNGKAIDKANSSIDKYKTKMNETEKAILQNTKALENMDKKINTAKLEKVADTTGKVGSAITKMTLPLVGAGIASAKFSMDFGDGMAKISTVADTSKISLSNLGKGIKNLSDLSGETFETIQEGEYDTISSGIKTEDSIKFLTTAVKSAKGGFTDTATSVDALTSTLNAYGLSANKVTDVSNQMMIAQNLGKTTFGQMAQSIGNVVPISSALKVKTNELFSSLAVLTANGIKTSEAVTGLKSAMSNIIKPSDEAKKASESLGLQFNANEVSSKGWMGFLKEVKDKLKDVAPEYATAVDKVNSLNQAITSGKGTISNHASEIQNLKNKLQGLQGASVSVTDYKDKIKDLRSEMKNLNSQARSTKDGNLKDTYREQAQVIAEQIKQLQALQATGKANAKSTKANNKEQIKAIREQIKVLQAQDKALKTGGGSSKELQKQLKEAKSQMKGLEEGSSSQLSAFAQMFGSVEGLNSVLTLTSDQGMKLYSDSMNQMASSGNVVDDAFNKVNSTTGENFKNSINKGKNSMIGFGDSMSPVVSNLAGGLNTITSWFNNLNQGQKNVVVGFSTFLVGSGLILTGISKLASGIKIATDLFMALRNSTLIASIATKTFSIAQGALNLVLSLNPIGIVVIALTALVGGLVLAYNQCTWFRNGVNGAFKSVADGAMWAVNKVGGLFGDMWQGIKDIGSNIKGFWSSIWNFKLPHIPLPHFDIKGKLSLAPPQTPYLDVQWYKNGGIMTQPTMFGMNGNSAMVGGEAGQEAVLPLNALWTQLEKNFSNLEQRLNNNTGVVYVYVENNLDGKKLNDIVTTEVTKTIGRKQKIRTV